MYLYLGLLPVSSKQHFGTNMLGDMKPDETNCSACAEKQMRVLGPTFPQLHLHHQSPEVCLLTNDMGQPSNVGGIPLRPLHNMWGYYGHRKKGSFRCEYITAQAAGQQGKSRLCLKLPLGKVH